MTFFVWFLVRNIRDDLTEKKYLAQRWMEITPPEMAPIVRGVWTVRSKKDVGVFFRGELGRLFVIIVSISGSENHILEVYVRAT